jgi:hypothetical protein
MATSTLRPGRATPRPTASARDRGGDWADPNELQERDLDLVLACDVLRAAGVAMLLDLLPRLAPVAWVADPGRPAADAFFEKASKRWSIETTVRGNAAASILLH